MRVIPLLPADTYTVINKSIITEDDKKNVIALYEPIIGPIAVSLYFTLLRDVRLLEFISSDYTHHHLMATMKSSLEIIKIARESLEGVGLLKTYYKEGDTNSYVYEIYSPLSPKEFFASPIFNITLYNNLGKLEYEMIVSEYKLPKIDMKEYEEITRPLNYTYKSSSNMEVIESREKASLNIKLDNKINFDLLISSFPKGEVNHNAFTKKTKELIEQLAYIYDIETMQMVDMIRMTINEKGTFDKEELRKVVRNNYKYNNGGKLPTLVYRSQPEYLKSPQGDSSMLGQVIAMFENTSPSDFLKIKYKGVTPTKRDLRILESLLVDLELQPAVVNVLLDYVLKKNDNKLNVDLIETIAGHWKRNNVETAREAMELAKKENSKYNKKLVNKKEQLKDNKPVWFDVEQKKTEISEEKEQELKEMLKDFG